MKISEDAKVFIGVASAVIGILLFLGVSFSIIKVVNCKQFQDASGLTTVSTLSECYVKTEKGLINLDRYQLNLIYDKK